MALEFGSVWCVTEESNLIRLSGAEGVSGNVVTNIIGNGYTVYYDTETVSPNHFSKNKPAIVPITRKKKLDKPAEKNDGEDPPRLFPDRPKYTNQRVPICFTGHSGFHSREVLFVSFNPYR